MNCNRVNKTMLLYLDNELDQSERGEFEAHLNRCPDCMQRLAQVKTTYSSIEKEKELIDTDPFLAQRVWELAKSRRRAAPRIRITLAATLAAAGLVMGILIGTAFNNVIQPKSSNDTWEQLAEDYFPEPFDYLTDTTTENE